MVLLNKGSCLAIILLLLPFIGSGQAPSGLDFDKPDITGTLGFSSSVTLLDLNLFAFSPGIYDRNNLWSIQVNPGIHPFEKQVTIKESENRSYKYRERRFSFNLLLDKYFYFGNSYKGFYLEFGAMFTVANYRGVAGGSDGQFLKAPGLGYVTGEGSTVIKVGVQYVEFPAETVLPIRGKFSLVGILGD